jgi:DNA-binding CsgD family transcriptional regulator
MADDWKLLVGQLSDREIARRFEIGASTVRRYRAANNIPEFSPSSQELPTTLLEQLETKTNYRLAKEFGVSAKQIKLARVRLGIPEHKVIRQKFKPLEDNIWTEEALALLGTMPDSELADLLGISNFPVKQKRKELGVGAYKPPYPEITPEIATEFGITSDSTLAKRLGVSASFIRKARLKWMKGNMPK